MMQTIEVFVFSSAICYAFSEVDETKRNIWDWTFMYVPVCVCVWMFFVIVVCLFQFFLPWMFDRKHIFSSCVREAILRIETNCRRYFVVASRYLNMHYSSRNLQCNILFLFSNYTIWMFSCFAFPFGFRSPIKKTIKNANRFSEVGFHMKKFIPSHANHNLTAAFYTYLFIIA